MPAPNGRAAPPLPLPATSPPVFSLPRDLERFHRFPFHGATYEDNLKAMEKESFCKKVGDYVHDLPALGDARTHPAVVCNLRSVPLIKAGLEAAVQALPMTQRTQAGLTKCVQDFMAPLTLGHNQAHGLRVLGTAIMLKVADMELAKASKEAKSTVLRMHSHPKQLVAELGRKQSQVRHQLVRVLASNALYNPASEFLQLVADNGKALRRGVAELYGSHTFEGMRAFIKGLPDLSLPNLFGTADDSTAWRLTDAYTACGYASLPSIQLLNDKYCLFTASNEMQKAQPALLREQIDEYVEALHTVQSVQQLLDSMRLSLHPATRSMMDMHGRLEEHLLPGYNVSGDGALHAMFNTSVKALRCDMVQVQAGSAAAAKHAQAAGGVAKQALQDAAAAHESAAAAMTRAAAVQERQAEDHQRLRRTQGTAHNASIAAEDAKKVAGRAQAEAEQAQCKVEALTRTVETLKLRLDEADTQRKRHRVTPQGSPLRVEELEGRRLFQAADKPAAGQPAASPAHAVALPLRGRNDQAFMADAAAASADWYLADEAAAVAGMGDGQPAFHPGCGDAALPEILRSRGVVRELARRPPQLQKAVRHEAARRKQADDAREQEREASKHRTPQNQLGQFFQDETGLELTDEAFGMLVQQQQQERALLAVQTDMGLEVELPTFAMEGAAPALAPRALQQQDAEFDVQPAAFSAAPSFGLPGLHLLLTPLKQQTPTAGPLSVTADYQGFQGFGLLAAAAQPGAGLMCPAVAALPALPADLFAALPDGAAASALPVFAPAAAAADAGGLAQRMAGLGLHHKGPTGMSQELGAALAGAPPG
ncbi:hypothetical protein ABPG75_000195 [Micractinium tetrahymenae]